MDSLTQPSKRYSWNWDAQDKVESLRRAVAGLKEEIKSLRRENEELAATLKRSRGINKGLLLIMHERGIASEGRSMFSLFKDVRSPLKI